MAKLRTIPEGTTAKYTATIKDEAGVAIPLASIDTITLTLFEKTTQTIINSRNAQNVKGANNVTIDVNGLLTWEMQPADNVIVNTTENYEEHIANFFWTYPVGGAKRGFHQAVFVIRNYARNP